MDTQRPPPRGATWAEGEGSCYVGEGVPRYCLGRGTSISEREVCVVAALGERAALVEAGPVLGAELRSGRAEPAEGGGGECDGDEHAPSIGACVPLL